MTQKKIPSLLGGAMIIAGTAIGAGMLANPTSTAGIWFVGSAIILFYTWFCMTTSGLMLLEANLHYPTGASFDTIVTDLLGKRWNFLNGLSVAFVLYILTYAYITSGGSITENAINSLQGEIQISRSIGSLLFCLVLGLFVWFSTKAVDRLSTILIGGMIIAFFLSTTGLLSSVSSHILLDIQNKNATAHLPYLLTALPVCLVSFGFHGNVPSLVKYYNRDGRRVMHSFSAFYLYIMANGCTRKPPKRQILSCHSQGWRCSGSFGSTKCLYTYPIYKCCSELLRLYGYYQFFLGGNLRTF